MWYNTNHERGEAMAPKKTNKNNTQLFLGVLALLVGILVLMLLGKLFQPAPANVEILPTALTEPTLPPPEANPYDPTDFQYDGQYLTCLSVESRLGIDVSSHQGQIDWQQVAQAGIEFAMIRVGYRGYETGRIVEDDMARANLAGAAEAGLDVGVYFYSQAVSPEEARAEADFVLNFLQETKLQMPVVFDWEFVSSEARTGTMDSETMTACTLTFCQRIQDAGYEPMIYFNQHLSEELFELERLTKYPFWLAMYDDRMTYPYRVDMWQYTCEGTVPGINGNADINLYFP